MIQPGKNCRVLLSFATYHKAKNLPYSNHIDNFTNKSDKLYFWQDSLNTEFRGKNCD